MERRSVEHLRALLAETIQARTALFASLRDPTTDAAAAPSSKVAAAAFVDAAKALESAFVELMASEPSVFSQIAACDARIAQIDVCLAQIRARLLDWHSGLAPPAP
eukprot:Amastigsp_a510506_21.p2 type:complete len:106 gc:universal Amastigsp_a510506_21:571-254(-)